MTTATGEDILLTLTLRTQSRITNFDNNCISIEFFEHVLISFVNGLYHTVSMITQSYYQMATQ